MQSADKNWTFHIEDRRYEVEETTENEFYINRIDRPENGTFRYIRNTRVWIPMTGITIRRTDINRLLNHIIGVKGLETITGDGFDIYFMNGGTVHVGRVNRVPVVPVQYHVVHTTPELNLQSNIFTLSPSGQLEFGTEPGNHEITFRIAEAINEVRRRHNLE